MTFISNSRAEELAKTLATQKTTISQKVEKTPENTNNETNIKTKGDEAKIENSNKSDNTIVLNLFDNDINIDELRKKILAGENVTITFPNMSKDQLIKKLFPDAKEVITGDLGKKFEEISSTYRSSESTYVSKEFGKFSVTSFSGCFTSGIKITKEAPPSFPELTISLTCDDLGEVNIFVNSGINAPPNVPQLIMVDSIHQRFVLPPRS